MRMCPIRWGTPKSSKSGDQFSIETHGTRDPPVLKIPILFRQTHFRGNLLNLELYQFPEAERAQLMCKCGTTILTFQPHAFFLETL